MPVTVIVMMLTDKAVAIVIVMMLTDKAVAIVIVMMWTDKAVAAWAGAGEIPGVIGLKIPAVIR